MNFVCRYSSGVVDFVFCVHPAGIDACIIAAQNVGRKGIPDDEYIFWRKVWRFFKKHTDTFFLFKLPGSYGAVICNMMYCQTENASSAQKTILRFVCKILILGRNTLSGKKTYLRLNLLLRLFGAVVGRTFFLLKSRVAPRSLYTRAYISSWIELSGLLDCKRVFGGTGSVRNPIMIRGE